LLQEVEEKEIVNPWEKPCDGLILLRFFCGAIPATASFLQNKAGEDPASAERGDHDRVP
jgi:hypothetical protein